MNEEQSYLRYIWDYGRAALSITKEWAALLIGGVWHALQDRFSGLLVTAPLFWLAAFWCVDFVLGSARAIARGEWAAKRALMSGTKLTAGALVLLVAHALRDCHVIGNQQVASLLETVVLLAELSSVLVHVGTMTNNRMILRIGLAFRRGSARAANKAMSYIDGKKEEEQNNDESTNKPAL